MEQKSCPCCFVSESTRMIQVRGVLVGIIGLEEAFGRVKKKGLKEEGEIKEALFQEIASRNYIPPEFEEDYKEALWREYKSFLAAGGK